MTPVKDEVAAAKAKDKYTGPDVDFYFANEWLSYTDKLGQLSIYKQTALPGLGTSELREVIDIMLRAIHWQGFRIDDKEVMEAICRQHEDGPKLKKFMGLKCPAGNAHNRIMSLLEEDENANYVRFLQGHAARRQATSVGE